MEDAGLWQLIAGARGRKKANSPEPEVKYPTDAEVMALIGPPE